jgi:protein-S-isoprenylcysteine O-methyltransferase Ste14
MKRSTAAIGSSVFFALAPGTVAGLVPWLLTGWRVSSSWWPPIRGLGWILIAAGAAAVIHAFVRFVVDGLGTPAPIAPPTTLVVSGAYRFVRNPMYVAVLAAIVGQALVLGSGALIWYAAGVFLVFATFVRFFEEPALRRKFGAEYRTYCAAVPAWIPRLTPWSR